jgi:hypothetical protein
MRETAASRQESGCHRLIPFAHPDTSEQILTTGCIHPGEGAHRHPPDIGIFIFAEALCYLFSRNVSMQETEGFDRHVPDMVLAVRQMNTEYPHRTLLSGKAQCFRSPVSDDPVAILHKGNENRKTCRGRSSERMHGISTGRFVAGSQMPCHLPAQLIRIPFHKFSDSGTSGILVRFQAGGYYCIAILKTVHMCKPSLICKKISGNR